MGQHITIIAAVFFVLIPGFVWSADYRPGPYVGGFLGVTVPRDTGVTSTDFDSSGSLRTFSDQVKFDPGINFGGNGGYDFGFIRLEGELSFKYAEIKTITASDGFSFGNPDGNVGVFSMLGNAFIDFHNQSPITPYLGGGVGFANIHLSDTFGTDVTSTGPERVLLYANDDDTVFAYQAGAGIGIALNRRLTLDLGYRYFGTSRARFGQGLDPTTEFKYESHNGAVGLRLKF